MKSCWQVWVGLWFCWGAADEVRAQAADFRLESHHLRSEHPIDLNAHATLTASPPNASLQEARQQPTRKLGLSRQTLSADSVYWVSLCLSSQLNQGSRWVFFTGRNNLVDVFIYRDQTAVPTHKRTGTYQKTSVKDLPEGKSCKVNLHLDAGEQVHILVKYQNIDRRPTKVDLRLEPYTIWEEGIHNRYLLQGIFNGIIWMLFIYNLLLFFISRDRVYLVYALYMGNLAMYFLYFHGLLEETIFGEFPWMTNYIWMASTGLASIFYLIFIQEFLNTKVYLPFWHRWLWYYFYFRLGFVIFALLSIAIYLHVPILNAASQLFALFEALLALVLYVALIRARVPLAAYFIIGSASLTSGLFVALLFYNVSSVLYSATLQTGVLLELLLFSVGLGYRIRLNEKAKREAQEKLIEQLQANEALQQRVNQELEAKIKERTADLEQKTHEVIAQSESLALANEEVKRQSDEVAARSRALEKAYSQIRRSINYAKRIQQALLGKPESLADQLDQSLSGSFVFFAPKDVVSGDFYWFTEHQTEEGQWRILAVGDCTGHGIPGAFMTILGATLLKEVVKYRQIIRPSEVLTLLNSYLVESISSLAQGQVQVNDGMELSVLAISPGGDYAFFAGAKSSLFFGKADSNLTRCKGDRYPIGAEGHYDQDAKSFEDQRFEIEKGDVFYLFTDGFQDQFGGESGGKYFNRNLMTFLQSMGDKPMSEQGQLLAHEYQSWKGTNPQTDDVLIVGLRI